MGFIRLVLFGAVALSVVYVLVRIYVRSVRRERLEKEWDAGEAGDAADSRDAYIDKGMQEFDASLAPKLILLVYVLPALLVAGIHIMTTYY